MSTRRRLCCVVVCLASLVAPQSALADCAHEIIGQAYRGPISGHFSQACYNGALRIEPIDGASYSDLDAVIRDAKRADALRDAISAAKASRSKAPREQHTSPPQPTNARPASSPAPREPMNRALSLSPATGAAGGGRDHPGDAARRPEAAPPATAATLLHAPPASPTLDRLAGEHAADVPLPVIALGVLVGLLVLMGFAGGLLRRRSRRRRA